MGVRWHTLTKLDEEDNFPGSSTPSTLATIFLTEMLTSWHAIWMRAECDRLVLTGKMNGWITQTSLLQRSGTIIQRLLKRVVTKERAVSVIRRTCRCGRRTTCTDWLSHNKCTVSQRPPQIAYRIVGFHFTELRQITVDISRIATYTSGR